MWQRPLPAGPGPKRSKSKALLRCAVFAVSKVSPLCKKLTAQEPSARYLSTLRFAQSGSLSST